MSVALDLYKLENFYRIQLRYNEDVPPPNAVLITTLWVLPPSTTPSPSTFLLEYVQSTKSPFYTESIHVVVNPLEPIKGTRFCAFRFETPYTEPVAVIQKKMFSDKKSESVDVVLVDSKIKKFSEFYRNIRRDYFNVPTKFIMYVFREEYTSNWSLYQGVCIPKETGEIKDWTVCTSRSKKELKKKQIVFDTNFMDLWFKTIEYEKTISRTLMTLFFIAVILNIILIFYSKNK